MKATFNKILSILFLALFMLTFSSCEKNELISPDGPSIHKKSFDDGNCDTDDGNAEGDITDDQDDDEDEGDITDDQDDDEDDESKSFQKKTHLLK